MSFDSRNELLASPHFDGVAVNELMSLSICFRIIAGFDRHGAESLMLLAKEAQLIVRHRSPLEANPATYPAP
jgi:hypothetical protein